MFLPDGHSNLFPYMMVQRAKDFLTFLQRVFDAEIMGIYEVEGVVRNARVRIGSVGFMVSEAQEGLGSMPGAYYLFVPDIDATHRRALEAGAEEITAPMDMDYDDRQSAIRDPFGNVWFPSTRLVDGPYED